MAPGPDFAGFRVEPGDDREPTLVPSEYHIAVTVGGTTGKLGRSGRVREYSLRLMVAALRFARAEAVLLGALAVVTLAVMGFVEVADDMTEADGQRFDRIVLEAVRTPGNPHDPIGPQWVEIAVTDLTALGGIAVLVALTAIVCGFLMIRRRGIAAMFILTALGGGIALSQGLKRYFARERPPLEYQAAEAVNASFPSGHAMLSAVVYLTIGAIVARAMPQRRLKLYVMTVAVLLAAIVGLSRIYLGVHWATDVMAGWCVGAAWAATCWLAARLFERFFGRAGVSRPQHLPLAPASSKSAPVIGE